LEHLEGLSAEGEKERDYLCRLPDRYLKLAERAANKKKKITEDETPKDFSWIKSKTK
jgi:acyl-[acyl-carrier-protein] desaturase